VDERARGAATRAWAGFAVLFLVVFAAFTAPLWLQRVGPRWDALDLLYPAFAVLSDGLRSGRFPLWDPYTNCGYPLYADAAVSTGLNPVALVLALVVPRPSLGFVLYWLAHWAWAGLGAMYLARAHRASPVGGFVAAIAYAFSGFFVGHGQHTPFVITAAWLPWCFALADGAVEQRRLGKALLAGVALGASAVGGYPALTTFSGVALAAWLVLRWLTPLGEPLAAGEAQRDRLRWIAATLALCAALLALLWAPALVAFFREGREYTERTGALPLTAAVQRSVFPPRALSSLLFPQLTLAASRWFPSDVSMTNGYAGLLAVPLAAVWVLDRRRRSLWLLAFSAFMLVLSFGGEYGVRTAVYYLVPVTRYMRHSGAFRLFWMMPLSLAAGCGASLVARHVVARQRFAWAVAVWTGVAAVVGLILWGAAISPLHVPRFLALRGIVPAVVVLAAIAAVALLTRRSSRIARVVPVVLSALWIADGAWHLDRNAGTVWASELFTRRLEQLPRSAIAFAPRQPEPVLPDWPWSMNIQQVLRVPIAGGYVTMLSQGFNEVLLRSRFREVLLEHRFWMSPGRSADPTTELELQQLASRGAHEPVPVFVASGAGPLADAVIPGSYGAATVSAWAPERIALRAIAPRGGLLVSTERYAAGWTARVDGHPARVERVNLYFVGVEVPAGEHDVVLTFRAGPYWTLAAVAAATALLASIAGIVLELRARRRARGVATGRAGRP